MLLEVSGMSWVKVFKLLDSFSFPQLLLPCRQCLDLWTAGLVALPVFLAEFCKQCKLLSGLSSALTDLHQFQLQLLCPFTLPRQAWGRSMALSILPCGIPGSLSGSFLSGIIGTVAPQVQMDRSENSCREIFRVLMRSWFVILWPLAFLFPFLTQSQRRQESRHTQWLLSSYCPLQASSQCSGAGKIKFFSNKSRSHITSTLPSRTIWAELSRIDLC